MTAEPVTTPLFLPRWLVEQLMFGSGRVRRFTQDTPVLPDGTPAPDNAALVRAAAAMITTAGQAP